MKPRLLAAPVLALAGVVAFAAPTQSQCTEGLSDLRSPIGSVLTNQGNLTTALHAGRISIVQPDGTRRTLIDDLPSASPARHR